MCHGLSIAMLRGFKPKSDLLEFLHDDILSMNVIQESGS
jgi:hypothetical protein